MLIEFLFQYRSAEEWYRSRMAQLLFVWCQRDFRRTAKKWRKARNVRHSFG